MKKAKSKLGLRELKDNLAASLKTNQTENIHEWVTKNNFVTEDANTPLSFEERPYLIDIYNDKGGHDGKGGKFVLSA